MRPPVQGALFQSRASVTVAFLAASNAWNADYCEQCSRGVVFVTLLRCAKTAARIEILFGVEAYGDVQHTVLDGGPDLMRPLPNYFGHLLYVVWGENGQFLWLNMLQFNDLVQRQHHHNECTMLHKANIPPERSVLSCISFLCSALATSKSCQIFGDIVYSLHSIAAQKSILRTVR